MSSYLKVDDIVTSQAVQVRQPRKPTFQHMSCHSLEQQQSGRGAVNLPPSVHPPTPMSITRPPTTICWYCSRYVQTSPAPLRTYLEAYYLRRSEECLALPPSRQDVTLQLSQPERMGHDAVIEETRRKFDALVSIGDRTTNELFKAILKMRMLCNQRTFNYSKLNNLSNLEEGCQRCLQRDADSTLLWKSSSSCPDCGRPLHKTRGNPGQTNSRTENKSESNSYIQNVEAGPFLVPT